MGTCTSRVAFENLIENLIPLCFTHCIHCASSASGKTAEIKLQFLDSDNVSPEARKAASEFSAHFLNSMKQVVAEVADADLVKRAQGGDQEAHAQLQKQLQARLETMMLEAVGKVETMLDDGTAGDAKPVAGKKAGKASAAAGTAAKGKGKGAAPPSPEAASQSAFNNLMASHFVNVDTPEALEAVLKGFERLPEAERKRLEGITSRVSELAKKMKSRRDTKPVAGDAARAQGGESDHDESAFEAAHLEDGGEHADDEHADGEYDDEVVEGDEYDDEAAEGDVHEDDDQGVTYDPDPRDRKVLSL